MSDTKDAPIVCEECGKVFVGKYAYYCPKCRSKRLSEAAKRRSLNKIGNEAYSKQQAELKRIEGR